MSDSNLQTVIDFVLQEVPKPRPKVLTADTGIYEDLRMIGSDADEFLFDFFTKYKIDYESFKFSEYFPADGFWPFSFKREQLKPLTLGMLAKALERGKWTDEG